MHKPLPKAVKHQAPNFINGSKNMRNKSKAEKICGIWIKKDVEEGTEVYLARRKIHDILKVLNRLWVISREAFSCIHIIRLRHKLLLTFSLRLIKLQVMKVYSVV